MLYFGNTLLEHTPEPCPGNNCDCLVHGFGLGKERSNHIIAMMQAHVDACRDENAQTVDFPRLMSGPAELDLLSPTEVLAAGYILGLANTKLTEWLNDVNPFHYLPEPVQQIIRDAKAKGGIVEVATTSESELDQKIRDFLAKHGRQATGDDEREAGK